MADASRPDSARDSVLPDGPSADGAPACAPAYQGDDAWTYALTAGDNAHYCVLGAGTTLNFEDDLDLDSSKVIPTLAFEWQIARQAGVPYVRPLMTRFPTTPLVYR